MSRNLKHEYDKPKRGGIAVAEDPEPEADPKDPPPTIPPGGEPDGD